MMSFYLIYSHITCYNNTNKFVYRPNSKKGFFEIFLDYIDEGAFIFETIILIRITSFIEGMINIEFANIKSIIIRY